MSDLTNEDFLLAKSIVESGMSEEEWEDFRLEKGVWPEDKEKWKRYRNYNMKKLIEFMDTYRNQHKGKD